MVRLLPLVLAMASCGGSAPDGAWLVFAPDAIRMSRRTLGESAVVSVPWSCRGRGAVRVVGVRADCGCARTTGLPEHVRGGQRGTLHVHLAPVRRAGLQRVRLRVYTDRPRPFDVATVRLAGWVGVPVAAESSPFSEGGRATHR